MYWRNREVPTFSGSAGSSGKPAYVEVMELVDRDGNVVTSFTKDVSASVAGAISADAIMTESTVNDAVVQTVYLVTVPLTNDEIKALPGENTDGNITLVESPGPGRAIIIVGGCIKVDTTAGAYATDADASWTLNGSSTGVRTVPILMQTALQATQVSIAAILPGVPGVGSGSFANTVVIPGFAVDPASLFEDEPLTIRDSFASVDDYTLGHADNSAEITVLYTIIDV